MSTRPAGWPTGRWRADPLKARTRAHYQAILDTHLTHFASRQLAAIKPKDVRAWYEDTLVDRPTLRSHAYSLLRTIMGSAVNDEILDGNPVPHRRRWAGQAGPPDPARVGR